MTRKLTILTLVLSILVEAEYFTEMLIYDELPSLLIGDFLFAFLTFWLHTFIQFYLIFFCNIKLINLLEKYFPWKQGFTKRSAIEFVCSTSIAILITIPLVVWVDHGLLIPLHQFPSDGLEITIYYNILYMVAINALFIVGYEIIFLNTQRKEIQLAWEKSQRQNILSKFEALKNQVDPHFLFNTLTALTDLIKKDPSKAVVFVGEFSNVYRRILDTNLDTLVSVKEELEFVNSYIVLQKIRFGGKIRVLFENEEAFFAHSIPPFSIQLLIENAIKHNQISSSAPLIITLRFHKDTVEVINTLNPVSVDESTSTKVGLANLKERYKLLSDRNPVFEVKEDAFHASLPLLKSED
ncbi:histidine kinase [Ekhidna sp.]|uniref:sensor histidine kinase n=1 Tax=Ekhidna sp. TaxID=2608089 RepID=UPI0032979BCE